MSQTMPILSLVQTDAKCFVEFWERLYSDYDEKFYRENIGQPLTEDRVKKWFEWKNGGRLSKRKAQSIHRYSLPEERIDKDADASMLRVFLKKPGGTIWRIFWLHLQHHERFPIYDQHVHRAMAFLLKWPTVEIPGDNPTKVETYIEHYLPFTKKFDGCNMRQMDRALWSFGRFLSLEYSKALTQ